MSEKRLPKGADMLAAIRRKGYRPAGSVFIGLDTDLPRPRADDDLRLSVNISIKSSDAIEDLDFWPLADLDIDFHGGDSMNDRVRAALKAIINAKPRFLMGSVPAEGLLFAWEPSRGWEFDHVA